MRTILAFACAAVALGAQGREGKTARDGFDLHWRLLGRGPKTVLVLSGGPGFDVDYMQPVANVVAPYFTAALLEQRGTGRSRPAKIEPANCTLALVTEDVEAFRKASGQQKLTIVGHSWGGGLAMLYAAAYPDRVERLALIGSMGMDLGFAAYLTDNVAMRLWPEDLALKAKSAAPIDQVLANIPGYFFDRAKALAFRNATPHDSYHGDVNAALGADLGRYDVKRSLAGFDRPVLLIQGRQDPVGDGTAYENAKVLKGARLVFLNRSGHFPWLETPQEFSAALLDFLRTP